MDQKLSILCCSKCKSQVSKPVKFYETGLDGAIAPQLQDEVEAIQSGFAFKSSKPYRERIGPKEDALEFVPQYWMTIADILPDVELTKDFGRLNGCCGFDGSGGPNRVCSCGAYIGTEMRDCWTSFLFIPDPQNTEWQTKQIYLSP